MADYILAIDQGTTSTRSVAFDSRGAIIASAHEPLTQHYPADGWVEHDGEEIWAAALSTMRAVVLTLDGQLPAAVGITNQRETTLIWDRRTGKAVHRAIVWQDRRTAPQCQLLREQGYGDLIRQRTGLVLDPYFSATKIAYILDSDPDLRQQAEAGHLAFGTIECFLIWRLTGGQHISDCTNAARTMLYDIHEGRWDDDLLSLFNIPTSVLPEVVANAGRFGVLSEDILGSDVPLCGMAGDQQAAAIGQACLVPGMVKSTYGTGAFVLQNTGQSAIASQNNLLTTIAYDLGQGAHYALEGSIFIAGAIIQWLRDEMGLLTSSAESAELARSVDSTRGVYLVPALTGLGAPHWMPEARGLICGLTRSSQRAHVVRAALEAVAYQTADLMAAFEQDGAPVPSVIRVDGGMAANDWFLQFLADVMDRPVERPLIIESTVQGAAFLAGLGLGWYNSAEDIAAQWTRDQAFSPVMDTPTRTRLKAGWKTALERAMLTS